MTRPENAADAPAGASTDAPAPVTYPAAAPADGPMTGAPAAGDETSTTADAHGTPAGSRRRGKRPRRGPQAEAESARPRQSNIAVPLVTHANLQAVQRRLGFARDRWVTLGETIDELIRLAEPGISEMVGELERQAAEFQAAREGS